MRRNIYLVFAVLIVLVAAGCLSTGALQMTMRPEERFDPRGRIYLSGESNDSLGIQDMLEHRLLKSGFMVKPDLPVKGVDKFLLKAKTARSGFTEYILKYRYHSRNTFIINRLVIDNFNAQLVNIDNNRPVLDIKFLGKRSAPSFIDALMEKMDPLMQ